MNCSRSMVVGFAALWCGLVSGCGGGSDGAARGTAEGLYGGAAAGGGSSTMQMLVLGDGAVWAFYGNQQAGQFLVNGFVQGDATCGDGKFYSGNARDFGFSPVQSGEVRATYLDLPTQRTIDGQISAGGQVTAFFGQEVTWGLYDYDEPAAVSKVAGRWLGRTGLGVAIRIDVGSRGEVSGSVGGSCSVSGTVNPHRGGKNVFDAELVLGAPCSDGLTAFSGVALSYGLGTGQSQLVVATTDQARVNGFWLSAAR